MTAWWDGNVTPFDLETDGTDPTDARIITACVGEVRQGEYGARLAANVQNWMAVPERDIPEGAAAVHGISTDQAYSEGHPREVVVEQIAAALAYGTADPENGEWGKVPVVGHNVGSYDLTVLDRELRRLGIGKLLDGYGGDPRVSVILRGVPIGAFYVIDTMVLDKAIDTFRPGPKDPVTGEKLGGRNKLTTVAEFYGVPIRGDAHAADADAMASGRIAWAIARRCALAQEFTDAVPPDDLRKCKIFRMYANRKYPTEVIRAFANTARLTLPELHEWQRRMAREQAQSFRQYCIENPRYVEEKGIDVGGIDGSWPVRPLTDASKSETVAAVSGEIL